MPRLYVTSLNYGEYAISPKDLPQVQAALDLMKPVGRPEYPGPYYLSGKEPPITHLTLVEVVLREPPAKPDLAEAAE